MKQTVDNRATSVSCYRIKKEASATNKIAQKQIMNYEEASNEDIFEECQQINHVKESFGKSDSDFATALSQELVVNSKANPMSTNSPRPVTPEKSNKVEKWRLGAYSSSKSGLSNSDDKKMSQWSKQLIELNLKPQKSKLPSDDCSLDGKEAKRMVASPRTPDAMSSAAHRKQILGASATLDSVSQGGQISNLHDEM